MNDTIGAGVKSVVDATGLLTGFYLDDAPRQATPPYGVFQDHVGSAPAQHGDAGVQWWTREMQIDVWQLLANEDVGIVRDLMSALNRATIGVAGCMRLRVASSNKVEETVGDNLSHYSITLSVAHREGVV